MLPIRGTLFAIPTESEHALVAPYVAAMTVAPTPAQREVLNTFCVALDNAGILSRLDRLYLLHSHDPQASRLNLLLPGETPLSAVNAPTFTAYFGWTGDSTTAYMATPTEHSGGARHYSLNDACMGLGVAATSGGGVRTLAGLISGGTCQIAVSNSTTGNFRINDSTNGGSIVAADVGNTRVGAFIADRKVVSTKSLYRNGIKLYDFAVDSTSTPANSGSLMRSASAYTADTFWFYLTGGSLSDAQHAALYSALSTYQTEYVA